MGLCLRAQVTSYSLRYFHLTSVYGLLDKVLIVAMLISSLECTFNNVSTFKRIFNNIIIIAYAVYLLFIINHEYLEFLKTSSLFIFLLSKYHEFCNEPNKIQKPSIITHIKEYKRNFHINKRALKDVLSDEERWLNLLGHGYFLCNHDMTLIYRNKIADQLMNELDMGFFEFIENLYDSATNLKGLILKIINSKKTPVYEKNEFTIVSKSKDMKSIGGELLCNYKVKICKLTFENVLIIIKKKDQFSTKALERKLEMAASSTLSHEMKTLLNLIVANLELIEEIVDRKHVTFYKFGLSSAKVLSSKLDDLLDCIQIKDQSFKVHSKKFSLEALIQEITEVCKWFAQQKNLKFSATIEINAPNNIYGDKERIRQILLNLLTKVIEYTDNGKILLRVKMKDDSIMFQVKSIGSGMHYALWAHAKYSSPKRRKEQYRLEKDKPEKAMENFEEMYLEIAHMIAKEIKAKINIKSQAIGESQFIFILPPEMVYDSKKASRKLFSAASFEKINFGLKENDLVNKEQKIIYPKKIDDCSDLDIPKEYGLPMNIVRKYSFSINSMPIFDQSEFILHTSPSVKSKFSCKKSSELFSERALTKKAKAELLPKYIIIEENIEKEKQNKIIKDETSFAIIPKIKGKIEPLSTNALKKSSHIKRRRTTVQLDPGAFRSIGARNCFVEGINSCNILIVDDNVNNRFVLKSLLKIKGYNSMEAREGSSAVRIVEDYIKNGILENLFLIFMDLQMPVMNGIESTKSIIELCKNFGLKSPPIIGVSSDTLEEDRQKFEQAGINEFFSKPLDKQKIDIILKTYIKD